MGGSAGRAIRAAACIAVAAVLAGAAPAVAVADPQPDGDGTTAFVAATVGTAPTAAALD
ncbi:MAG: hypothetical protein JWQ92_2371, partial [Amnibacterium sp.]|nr:hypothetical protein [Amnibacterium sp.]